MYIKLVGVYISDIHLQVLYTPTSFLQEIYMKFIHLLLSNLIGQNVQAMHHGTSIGYIMRCRSIRDLHTEGRRPRGCVNAV